MAAKSVGKWQKWYDEHKEEDSVRYQLFLRRVSVTKWKPEEAIRTREMGRGGPRHKDLKHREA